MGNKVKSGTQKIDAYNKKRNDKEREKEEEGRKKRLKEREDKRKEENKKRAREYKKQQKILQQNYDNTYSNFEKTANSMQKEIQNGNLNSSLKFLSDIRNKIGIILKNAQKQEIILSSKNISYFNSRFKKISNIWKNELLKQKSEENKQ